MYALRREAPLGSRCGVNTFIHTCLSPSLPLPLCGIDTSIQSSMCSTIISNWFAETGAMPGVAAFGSQAAAPPSLPALSGVHGACRWPCAPMLNEILFVCLSARARVCALEHSFAHLCAGTCSQSHHQGGLGSLSYDGFAACCESLDIYAEKCARCYTARDRTCQRMRHWKVAIHLISIVIIIVMIIIISIIINYCHYYWCYYVLLYDDVYRYSYYYILVLSSLLVCVYYA